MNRLFKYVKSSLVKPLHRKLNRSIRAIIENPTDELASTTQNPPDDTSDDDIDTLFGGDELSPDDDNSFSLICDDVQFECKSADHKCIPLESWCDGRVDCSDGSDESSCASTPAIPYSIVNETTTTQLTTSTEKLTTAAPIVDLNTTTTTTMKPSTSTESQINTTTTEKPTTTTTSKVQCEWMIISSDFLEQLSLFGI